MNEFSMGAAKCFVLCVSGLRAGFPVRLPLMRLDNCLKWEMVRVKLWLISPAVSHSNILRLTQFYLTPLCHYKCTRHLWTLLLYTNTELLFAAKAAFILQNCLWWNLIFLCFSSCLCSASFILFRKSILAVLAFLFAVDIKKWWTRHHPFLPL